MLFQPMTLCLNQPKKIACIAGHHFTQKRLGMLTSSVQMPASQHTGGRLELTTLKASASTANKHSCTTSTPNERLVVDHVQIVCDTGERNKVYDIEVDGVHEFVAGGILVHNCRYALEPIMKRKNAPKFSVSMY